MTTPAVQALSAEDRESIRVIVEERWTEGIVNRQWQQLMSNCDPHIVYMPMDNRALSGHDALTTWLYAFPRIVRLRQPLVAVDGRGDIAIARASFVATIDKGGTHVSGEGKVLCSLRKTPEGQWLVTAICWNWDHPLSPS